MKEHCLAKITAHIISANCLNSEQIKDVRWDMANDGFLFKKNRYYSVLSLPTEFWMISQQNTKNTFFTRGLFIWTKTASWMWIWIKEGCHWHIKVSHWIYVEAIWSRTTSSLCQLGWLHIYPSLRKKTYGCYTVKMHTSVSNREMTASMKYWWCMVSAISTKIWEELDEPQLSLSRCSIFYLLLAIRQSFLALRSKIVW